MKKKKLQEYANSLARQVDSLVGREQARQEKAQSAFEDALHELRKASSSHDEVFIMVSGGHLLRATVLQVESKTDMINVGNGFLPGLREVTVHLSPRPGLEEK